MHVYVCVVYVCVYECTVSDVCALGCKYSIVYVCMYECKINPLVPGMKNVFKIRQLIID